MIGFPKTKQAFLDDVEHSQKSKTLQEEMRPLFQNQLNHYLLQGLPHKKTEGWRYFPTQKITKKQTLFNHAPVEEVKDQKPSFFPKSFLISIQNGNLKFDKPPEGIQVFPWGDFLKGVTPLSHKIKNKIYETFKKERNGFCSLNNLLSFQGCIVVVSKPIKHHIELQYIHSLKEKDQGFNLRSFVFIEKASSAQVAETFYGNLTQNTNSSFFFNLQTDCFLGEESQLNYIRLDQGHSQDIQMNQLFLNLDKNSKAKTLTLNLNSGLSRYSTEISQKRKSLSHIRGLSILGEDKHAEHQVLVKHEEEQSQSVQFFQSFLFDSARHVFNGSVQIKQSAQKTDASQMNKNLIFNDKAFAVSCPHLDIEADNVKAVHGATVSFLAEQKQAIFYLMSRGLSFKDSYNLVVSGLIQEALSQESPATLPFLQSLIWDCLKEKKLQAKEML